MRAALLGGAVAPEWQPLLWALQASQPVLPVAVAYSGGADSSAMLCAAHQLWPGQVHAIHVHHGLQAAADDFVVHCQTFCQAQAVPLTVLHIPDAQAAPGESPEDAARRARYRALTQAAQDWGLPTVLLAHHADDQIETLLLALSRGAGLPGLSAMPERAERQGLIWQRPWLHIPGRDLRLALKQAALHWVEDPSNQESRYTRNRIRAELLPALEAVFPSFRRTFARSAEHAAQAQAVLSDMAAIDLQQVGDPPRIAALQALPSARLVNVLRHWLRRSCHTTASAAQMQEAARQIRACTTRGHQLRLKVGMGVLTRCEECLCWTEHIAKKL